VQFLLVRGVNLFAFTCIWGIYHVSAIITIIGTTPLKSARTVRFQHFGSTSGTVRAPALFIELKSLCSLDASDVAGKVVISRSSVGCLEKIYDQLDRSGAAAFVRLSAFNPPGPLTNRRADWGFKAPSQKMQMFEVYEGEFQFDNWSQLQAGLVVEVGPPHDTTYRDLAVHPGFVLLLRVLVPSAYWFVSITAIIGMLRLRRMPDDEPGQWRHEIRRVGMVVTFVFGVITLAIGMLFAMGMWAAYEAMPIAVYLFFTPMFVSTQTLVTVLLALFMREEALAMALKVSRRSMWINYRMLTIAAWILPAVDVALGLAYATGS
jgi:hypothetical protein